MLYHNTNTLRFQQLSATVAHSHSHTITLSLIEYQRINKHRRFLSYHNWHRLRCYVLYHKHIRWTTHWHSLNIHTYWWMLRSSGLRICYVWKIISWFQKSINYILFNYRFRPFVEHLCFIINARLRQWTIKNILFPIDMEPRFHDLFTLHQTVHPNS